MFDSAYLKVSRAQKHIGDLEKAFAAFVADDPYTMSIQNDPQGGLSVRLKLTKPMPNEIGLIIGDAVHNLRASLDHAVWELIGLDGGTQDRWTKLPASSTGVIDYKAMCRGIKTPRDDTKQFFVDLAVHNESGSLLYALHLLDNTDKHVIILPLLEAGTLTYARVVRPDGCVLVELSDITLVPRGTSGIHCHGPRPCG